MKRFFEILSGSALIALALRLMYILWQGYHESGGNIGWGFSMMYIVPISVLYIALGIIFIRGRQKNVHTAVYVLSIILSLPVFYYGFWGIMKWFFY